MSKHSRNRSRKWEHERKKNTQGLIDRTFKRFPKTGFWPLFTGAFVGALLGAYASDTYAACHVTDSSSLLGTVQNPLTGQYYNGVCLIEATGLTLLTLVLVAAGSMFLFQWLRDANSYLNTHPRKARLLWSVVFVLVIIFVAILVILGYVKSIKPG